MKKVIILSLGVSILMVASQFAFAATHDDDRIVSSIKNSYTFKNYLKNDAINVQSSDGVVTLKGTVLDEDHRSLAESTASNMPQVEDVKNELQVSGEKLLANSDGWVGVKVKSALLFHRNVSAIRTQVEVSNGVVTLKGEAENQSQKDLATEYARDVEGVKNVKNEMKIVPLSASDNQVAKTIDDASITAQVKVSLLTHQSTSAIRTKIKTKDGNVTVTGKAKDQTEKDLVTRLVQDIDGVKNVVNNMEVQ